MNSEYKRSCHESSIRIPAAMFGPGAMNGGQIRELVSLIDLPPTLLDAAGIPVPEAMQGRSAMPLIRKEMTEWPAEAFVQISEGEQAPFIEPAPSRSGGQRCVSIEERRADVSNGPVRRG